MSFWLKYTVLYSDFQPCTEKYASITLDIVPRGSFIQNIKVRANDNFTGPGVTGALITASFQGAVYDIEHSLDVWLHPFVTPDPPIPQSRTVLLPNTSRQLIKINLKTIGNPVNSLSSGACDIYFQMNTITYPFTLDLIFKQPVFVISFKHLLSAYLGNVVIITRLSDGALKTFGFINGFIDNAGIITWLAGSGAVIRVIYSQTGGTDQLFTAVLNTRPAYDPITSLVTFDGVDDYLTTFPVFTLSDFFLSVKNTPDINQIIGARGFVASAIIRNLVSVFFRNLTNQFIFNINSIGLLRTFIMSNNNVISCHVDNIEAGNSPRVFGTGGMFFDQVGAKKQQLFFTGDFNELIIYDTPLSNSEMLLINSI